MIEYVLIVGAVARRLIVADTDATVIPPDASLIVTSPEWAIMCQEAGGEELLLATLGAAWEEETWPQVG